MLSSYDSILQFLLYSNFLYATILKCSIFILSSIYYGNFQTSVKLGMSMENAFYSTIAAIFQECNSI